MLTQDALEKYLHRIEFTGPFTQSPEILSALQWAHLTHIPYENLNISAIHEENKIEWIILC